MELMKKIWKFILNNVDTIIAIAVSILAAIFGIFGGNQIILLAGIAATLAIMAFGLIRDRLSRDALGEQIIELKRNLPERPSAMSFFRSVSDFDTRIKNAMSIDICGVTLTNTINTQFAVLRERLKAGGNLRFLIIDPESQAIDMSAQRSVNPKDTIYYQRRLESTFADLTYLYKFNEDLKSSLKKDNAVGSISVRLLSYAPSFGIISLDEKAKQGIVRVEIYPHKFGFRTPPSFVLTPDNDKEWYNYFIEQYEQMWKTSKPWDPTPFVQSIPFDESAST
jgi:hypothetical protein